MPGQVTRQAIQGEKVLMRRTGGFTLIELMITVVVVAILAAIAYPSYLSYLVRSNRAAAQSALMDIAQREQQYLLDARAYAPDLATLNVALPPAVSAHYTVAIVLTAGPPPAFARTSSGGSRGGGHSHSCSAW